MNKHFETCQQPSCDDDINTWLDWCVQRLSGYAETISHDPMVNSVQRFSHDLSQMLVDGEISVPLLHQLTNHISDTAFRERAERFAAHHNAVGSHEPEGFFADIAPVHTADSFEQFKNAVETTGAGIVFTGHPTFAISRAQRDGFAAYATNLLEGKTDTTLAALPHRPDDVLSLSNEHEDVTMAIRNAARALDTLNGFILEQAEQKFPDQWHQLVPRPVSIASWVGYDLDGRTDIHWGQTLTIRLEEKAAQLRGYAQSLEALIKTTPNTTLERIISQLNRAALLTEKQAEAFGGDLNDPAVVVAAANILTAPDDDRLISLTPVIAEIGTIIEQMTDSASRKELCLIRARMVAMGLGISRIHLRVNAAQVRSALRHDFGVRDDSDFLGRSTLAIAAEQAQSADTLSLNFGALFLEQMTARRQLMLCAQILKHIDSDTPIRFLIAECEAPATIMGAVYLARLYGVDHKLDISPLFETPSAVERGGRFLERLLAEEAFVDYIKQRRCISIQLGFSDSGRFMGQIAADLAIERLQILLARAMGETKKRGVDLTQVQALIFNTNGESMGRGTPPGTIEDRLFHLMTPWARATFARHNITTNIESSFQGGEGFLHFHTPQIAEKTLFAVYRTTNQLFERHAGDAFYDDINFSWDFYRAVKRWQEDLFENPDYTRAIASFAHRFLFTTGSRKTRRQKKGSADMSPRALRAIPHNAILQQLAIPANVAGGIGSSVQQEKDRFVTHVKNSDRVCRLIRYAGHARNLTSLPAFLGYTNIYNATYWTRRATAQATAQETAQKTTQAGNEVGVNQQDTHLKESYQAIAKQLECQTVYTGLSRLANHLAVDLAAFDEILEAVFGEERTLRRRDERLNLHVLHAVRQALMMHALILISRVPAFSGRHEVRRADLIDLVLTLQFDEVTTLLDDIFPVIRPEVAALSGITETTSLDLSKESGYPEVQEDIRNPLAQIEKAIREIGVGVSHFYGAYG